MSFTAPFRIEPCTAAHAADIGTLLLRGFPELLTSNLHYSEQQAQLLADLWLLDRKQDGHIQWVAVNTVSHQPFVIGTLSLRYGIQPTRQHGQDIDTGQDVDTQQNIATRPCIDVQLTRTKWKHRISVSLSSSLCSPLQRTMQLFWKYGFWQVSKLWYRLYQLSYQPQPNECYIEHLVVDSAFRRLGIAEQLLIKAQQFCQQQRYRYLSLHVSSINQHALQLYTKRGFTFAHPTSSFSKRISHSTLWQYGRWYPTSSIPSKEVSNHHESFY